MCVAVGMVFFVGCMLFITFLTACPPPTPMDHVRRMGARKRICESMGGKVRFSDDLGHRCIMETQPETGDADEM